MEAISHMRMKNDSKTERIICLPSLSLPLLRKSTAFWVFCQTELWLLEPFQGEICALCTSVCLPASLRAQPIIGARKPSRKKWAHECVCPTPSPSTLASLTVSWRYFTPPCSLVCPSLLYTQQTLSVLQNSAHYFVRSFIQDGIGQNGYFLPSAL